MTGPKCFFIVYRYSTEIIRSTLSKQNITYLRSGAPDLRLERNKIKNPNWQEASSWLFTLVAEDLNSGHTEYKSSKWPARAGLEPGTAGLQVRRTDHLATLSPHYKPICPPASFFFSFFFFSSQFLFFEEFNDSEDKAFARGRGRGRTRSHLHALSTPFASSEFPAVLVFVRALDYL